MFLTFYPLYVNELPRPKGTRYQTGIPFLFRRKRRGIKP